MAMTRAERRAAKSNQPAQQTAEKPTAEQEAAALKKIPAKTLEVLISRGAISKEVVDKLKAEGVVTSGKGVGRGAVRQQISDLLKAKPEAEKLLETMFSARESLNEMLEKAGHKGYNVGIWLKHPAEKAEESENAEQK